MRGGYGGREELRTGTEVPNLSPGGGGLECDVAWYGEPYDKALLRRCNAAGIYDWPWAAGGGEHHACNMEWGRSIDELCRMTIMPEESHLSCP